MDCSKDELELFKDLGSSNKLPVAGVISSLDYFTMCLYISNIKSTIASIGDLWWYPFWKNQCQGEKPPPTLNALNFKIYRNDLVTMIFKQSTEIYSNIQSEANYKHHHKIKDRLSPQESTIEMSLCRCQKSRCNSRTCVCVQACLVCTKTCRCVDRKNELKEYIN